MKITNIKTEYLNNPIGIDVRSPRITWVDEDIEKQTAFEIFYKVNGKDRVPIKVESDLMRFDFKEEFKSRDRVEFNIVIYDEAKKASEKSETHFFEMGLLEPTDWKAQWIAGNYKVNKKLRYPVDCFRKEFDAKDIKLARLYITAAGLYEASINENRVGNFILAPGSTDYTKRYQYQTYDVTKLILNGKNTLSVFLADGWYRGSIGAKGFTNVFGTQTKFIAQLEIEKNNGDKDIICSDDSFDWSNDGPITFADLKDGEIVDNQKTITYSSNAIIVKNKANLTASNNNFVVEINSNKPIKRFKAPSGKTILEFKNNIAGYIAFKVKAHAGDVIKCKMGEMLDKDGELTLKNVQCIRKGKLTPLQEVTFICKEGENEYHSKFFLAGFKYLEVDTNVEFDENDFEQIALCTDFEDTSTFECSNNLINIFYDNTLRSLRSNSIDIPTDCPTRERMGWTGDSQVFFETATFLTDYSAFTRKHLVDVYDRQFKDGRLPQIAPYSAEDWFMNVMNGSVGWADVGILSPYRFYKKYGDIRILENNFEGMKRYADFMISRCGRTKGIYKIYAKNLHLSKENRRFQVNTGQSYGEWAEPADVKAFVWTDFCEPHAEESMAYTAWMLELMVEICKLLGKEEYIAKYQEYANGIKKAYQELVTKPENTIDTNRQAKLVRPLYLNLLTDNQAKFAKDRLIKALDFYKWRLGTGFLSTPFILYVLSDINPEYAYKLLENEDMPGWLYMAINNTGTIWEGWEGPNSQAGIASLNHYSKGAMVEWLFKGMLGINIIEDNTFEIKPIIGGKETFAKGSYKSIYGEIKVSWKKENDSVIFDIHIPANTQADFEFNGKHKQLKAGEYNFAIKG